MGCATSLPAVDPALRWDNEDHHHIIDSPLSFAPPAQQDSHDDAVNGSGQTRRTPSSADPRARGKRHAPPRRSVSRPMPLTSFRRVSDAVSSETPSPSGPTPLQRQLTLSSWRQIASQTSGRSSEGPPSPSSRGTPSVGGTPRMTPDLRHRSSLRFVASGVPTGAPANPLLRSDTEPVGSTPPFPSIMKPSPVR